MGYDSEVLQVIREAFAALQGSHPEVLARISAAIEYPPAATIPNFKNSGTPMLEGILARLLGTKVGVVNFTGNSGGGSAISVNKPLRSSRRHAKIKVVATPWRLATNDTRAPGCPLSSTIAFFSAIVYLRRGRLPWPSSILAADSGVSIESSVDANRVPFDTHPRYVGYLTPYGLAKTLTIKVGARRYIARSEAKSGTATPNRAPKCRHSSGGTIRTASSSLPLMRRNPICRKSQLEFRSTTLLDKPGLSSRELEEHLDLEGR